MLHFHVNCGGYAGPAYYICRLKQVLAMAIVTAQEVFSCMDSCGALGRPFLFAVDFGMEEGIFTDDPAGCRDVLFDVRGVTNAAGMEASGRVSPLEVAGSDRQKYMDGFAVVRAGLERGDTFLINLTARTEVSTDMTLEDIFLRSAAPYRICVPGRFVCFSPECFVRISAEGRISTYPMKGTADATRPDAARRLMDDYKEQCEHYTITDLLRNDLNMVASQVRVDRYRYMERIRTLKGEILQTSSEISGLLPQGWKASVGSIVRRLLPAGSISGAPKSSTLELIRRAEVTGRGFYTGVFGYFDGRSLDSAVMIRFIEQDGNGRMFFRSGGGVTINSYADSEYEEVLEKVYLSLR